MLIESGAEQTPSWWFEPVVGWNIRRTAREANAISYGAFLDGELDTKTSSENVSEQERYHPRRNRVGYGE